MTTWITLADYARRCGVSRQAAHAWKAAGTIIWREHGEGGQRRVEVDVEASDALRASRQNPMKRVAPAAAPATADSQATAATADGFTGSDTRRPIEEAPGRPLDPLQRDAAESRARLEQIKVSRAEIDLAEKRGRLVDRIAVEEANLDIYRGLREAMLGVPARISDRLAALDDPRAVRTTLAEAIRSELDRFTRGLEARLVQAEEAFAATLGSVDAAPAAGAAPVAPEVRDEEAAADAR